MTDTIEHELVSRVRARHGFSQRDLGRALGASEYAVARWEDGAAPVDPHTRSKLERLLDSTATTDADANPFASHGSAVQLHTLPLFQEALPYPLDVPRSSVTSEFFDGQTSIWQNGVGLGAVLAAHSDPSPTRCEPFLSSVSAGKNTYTYDAHTYHTKVPPQGISQVIDAYLPDGGLVLDPFSGSGMTGVAAIACGNDVILNELSPAASFISYNFTHSVNNSAFLSAASGVVERLHRLRNDLYRTTCRECSKPTEILYTVWSYNVLCPHCGDEFRLWDHSRKYGRNVREHKFLKEFSCPCCKTVIKKSRLKRTDTEPVLVGYRCCSKKQIEHEPNDADLARLARICVMADSYRERAPQVQLPDGVNLNQPKRHGLDSIDRFYTPRNLIAMVALWEEIRRIPDPDLARSVAFAFTSLYQRVTRLSEYRFWGGSGNTANFNVPYISNEANVFVTFLRKAKSIADHYATTAEQYTGHSIVRTGSATDLSFLPDNSVDFVFTDPPFGANINYSEMNILWEAWLGDRTDAREEAIVSRSQGKDVAEYERLMRQSLCETYRVLRSGHWMVLVFMNSSEKVWTALSNAIRGAGFEIANVSVFDKQHGTFKQFVSDNAAGSDVMIHCRKPTISARKHTESSEAEGLGVRSFLQQRNGPIPRLPYIHVSRETDIDYRTLYSEYTAKALGRRQGFVDFSIFRDSIAREIETVADA